MKDWIKLLNAWLGISMTGCNEGDQGFKSHDSTPSPLADSDWSWEMLPSSLPTECRKIRWQTFKTSTCRILTTLQFTRHKQARHYIGCHVLSYKTRFWTNIFTCQSCKSSNFVFATANIQHNHHCRTSRQTGQIWSFLTMFITSPPIDIMSCCDHCNPSNLKRLGLHLHHQQHYKYTSTTPRNTYTSIQNFNNT